jgi:hypothetical protein
MIASDPTEAVRAEELLAFTGKTFEVLEQKNLGGTILQHLLYEIVENFRFEVPRERSLLQMLCTIEAMLVDGGVIPSDFVLLAARRKGSRVQRLNRPLPPRAEGAEDVEPDPFTGAAHISGQRNRRCTPLQRDHFRLLRLALLATQPRRANLFEERRVLEWRERFRARKHTPFAWLLARAPDDPAVRELLETAATLAPA